MSAGMAEYFLESHVWPQLKQQQGLAFAGLVLVIVGEALRKLAMVGKVTPCCLLLWRRLWAQSKQCCIAAVTGY
jgi:hypothetical protein